MLFTPFGFGLAEKLRERGKSRLFAFVAALIVGACFSYMIEFLQNYIPGRDSGWEDVLTNSSGAVVGCLLFYVFGRTVLPILSACERALGERSSGWRAAGALALYFALWFAASIPLQREARLNNWNPDSLLTIGNDASGKNPWVGQLRLIQIWDRAVSNDEARRIFAAIGSDQSAAGLLLSYDFLSTAPLRDGSNPPDDLVWTPKPPAHSETNSVDLDGSSWLSSQAPVSQLVAILRKTNQFALQIVCTPAKTNRSDARILSIFQPSGSLDLNVREEGTALVFWFRNGISAKKSLLSSHVPDVFKTGETRDILYSYDGSNLSLYVDGKPQAMHYELGPGAALATLVGHRVKSPELAGYNYVYYALVFLPAGTLLGIAARRRPPNRFVMYVTFGAGILIVPLLLEFILVSITGRSFSVVNLSLSIALLIGGILWINADRHPACRAP